MHSGNERVLFAGDLLHFTFQLNDPGFRSAGDEDPDQASHTRTAWLARTESEGLLLATAMFRRTPSVASSANKENASSGPLADTVASLNVSREVRVSHVQTRLQNRRRFAIRELEVPPHATRQVKAMTTTVIAGYPSTHVSRTARKVVRSSIR